MAYRSALITGASSGIGAAFARVLPPTTDLVLTARSAERLQRVAQPLAVPPRRVDIVAADLAMAKGRGAVIEQALAHDLDLFVCNAGTGRAGSFLETPLAVQQEGLAVNVLAVVELVHALLPPMIAGARRRQGRAGVIIVSSMGAFGDAPRLAGYGAAKAFELHLARSLAAELKAEPIDVLALCPTYTETAFFARAGLPPPPRAMAPEAVAREALAALGRRSLHLCSLHHYPQGIRQLVAANPLLALWRWPRQIAAKLRSDAARDRPARRAHAARAR
jgi:short-subunit dehydrogenase